MDRLNSLILIGGTIMAKKNSEATTTATETTATTVDIIRGRMPMPIVWLIRFEESTASDGATAKKYRTTNGKVNDIRKVRNFGYITADSKFSAEDLEAAKAYASQLSDAGVTERLNQMQPGDATSVEALVASRKSTRKPRAKAAETAAAALATPAVPEAVAESTGDDEIDGLLE